jgi:uncharacterized protein (TIGR02147 family)
MRGDRRISPAMAKKYAAGMELTARESLENVPVEKREISGLTMGVSNECIERIKQRIRIFKEEIISMIVDDKKEPASVYQMNFQFFPLIKPADTPEERAHDAP